MRTYSSFCGTVCSDSTGTVTSDAAVRLHRRYQAGILNRNFYPFNFFNSIIIDVPVLVSIIIRIRVIHIVEIVANSYHNIFNVR